MANALKMTAESSIPSTKIELPRQVILEQYDVEKTGLRPNI